MADIEITCKDCGQKFDFTEGEQRFYLEKDFVQPVRCPDCRRRKKDEYNAKAGNASMSNVRRNKR